jgi:hypothetical protein
MSQVNVKPPPDYLLYSVTSEPAIADRSVLSPEAQIQVADAIVYAGKRVQRHIASEFANDSSVSMATVSTAGPLCFVCRDQATGELRAVTDFDAVKEQYDQRCIPDTATTAHLVGWRDVMRLQRDWYVFLEGVTTARDRNGVDSTVTSVVLFPLGDDDGIVGEQALGASRNRALGGLLAPTEGSVPVRRLRNSEVHDRLLEVIRKGSAAELATLLTEDIDSVVRDYTGGPFRRVSGRDNVEAFFAAQFKALKVNDLEILNACTGEWGTFSEVRWDVTIQEGGHTGKRAQFCTATMYAITNDGRIDRQIGFGTPPVYQS